MKKLQETSTVPKSDFRSRFSILVILIVICIASWMVLARQQLQRQPNPPATPPSVYGTIAPSVDIGGCQEEAEKNCLQTLLVSQHGKIETVTEKETGRTSLKLTNTKGKVYVFSDPDDPFISYEQAASNNTKAVEDGSGYYLISAANRGKDGSHTFNKIYEVWLGDTLSVKNIISTSAYEVAFAPPSFLKSSGNQLSYFVVKDSAIHLVVYNLSENLIERDDTTPEVLLKTNLPWYKNNQQGHSLASVSSVPLGYVFSFTRDGELKGTANRMVFWETNTKHLVVLK